MVVPGTFLVRAVAGRVGELLEEPSKGRQSQEGAAEDEAEVDGCADETVADGDEFLVAEVGAVV